MTANYVTMKNSDHKTPGFTIIELLVVVTILIILMGIFVPKVGSMMAKAKENQCRNNLKQLHTAFISYTTDHDGHYPRRFADEWYDYQEGVFTWHNGWVSWANGQLNWKEINDPWKKNPGTSHSDEMRDDLGTGNVSKFCVENGELFPYMNKSLKHYVCPIMAAKKKDAKVSVYRTYAMGNRFASSTGVRNNFNGAKTLLFSEIVPTSTESESENRVKWSFDSNRKLSRSKEPGRRQGDCCLNPKDETGGEDFIAYDLYDTTLTDDESYGIHDVGSGGKGALAVFLDGHIEMVFSRTPNKKLNTAYYYVRGQDPYLED